MAEPVERWFKELTDKQLRRSSFTSTSDLIDTIDEWAEHWNEDPKPFVWTRRPRRSSPRSDAAALP